MPEVTINISDDQAKLLKENAIRNFPELTEYEPKAILEFIIKATTENDRRKKVMDKARSLSIDDLEEALKDK